MGKWCLHANSFIFEWIIMKVAGNQDRHKSLNMFDFRPDQTTCTHLPLNNDNFKHSNVYLFGQLASFDQIICVASIGVGKGYRMFWGRLDQNSGVSGNKKPPLTYNGENSVSMG